MAQGIDNLAALGLAAAVCTGVDCGRTGSLTAGGNCGGSFLHIMAQSVNHFLLDSRVVAAGAVGACGQAGCGTGCIDGCVGHNIMAPSLADSHSLFLVFLGAVVTLYVVHSGLGTGFCGLHRTGSGREAMAGCGDLGAGLDGYVTFTDAVAGVAGGSTGGSNGIFGMVVAGVDGAVLIAQNGSIFGIANVAAMLTLSFIDSFIHAVACGDQVALHKFTFVPLANSGTIDGFGIGFLQGDIRTAGVEVKGEGGNGVGIGIGSAVDLAAYHGLQVALCIIVLGNKCIDGSTGTGPYSFIQSTYFLCMTRQAQLSGKAVSVALHDDGTAAVGLHDATEVGTLLHIQHAVNDQVGHHAAGGNTIQGGNLAQRAVNRIVGRGCSAVIIGFCIIYFRVRRLVKDVAFLALRACTVIIRSGKDRQLHTGGDCQHRIGVDL